MFPSDKAKGKDRGGGLFLRPGAGRGPDGTGAPMPGKGIQESLQTLKPFVEALFRSDEAVADYEVHDVSVDVRWLGGILDGGKQLLRIRHQAPMAAAALDHLRITKVGLSSVRYFEFWIFFCSQDEQFEG